MGQNDELIIRMECLKLACATAGTTEPGETTIKKAEAFFDFVKAPKSTIVKPKLVTQ
jgi:hypothetical protein